MAKQPRSVQHHSEKVGLRKGIHWTYLSASQTPPSIAKILIDILSVPWCARIPSWTLIRISPISRQRLRRHQPAPRFLVALRWSRLQREAEGSQAKRTGSAMRRDVSSREPDVVAREEAGGGGGGYCRHVRWRAAFARPGNTQRPLAPQAVLLVGGASNCRCFSFLAGGASRLLSRQMLVHAPCEPTSGQHPPCRPNLSLSLSLSLEYLLPLGMGRTARAANTAGSTFPPAPLSRYRASLAMSSLMAVGM
jgi:hypothetical protein